MADEAAVLSPATLTQALRYLAEGGPDVRPLAGGTDAAVKQKEGVWQPRAWVNLMRLTGELAYIRREADTVRVGALTSMAEILRSPELQATAPLLLMAARTIGGPAIRNRATLGGNIATASPAGDSLPALYCLDARVCVAGLTAEREIPIADFFRGLGRTALAAGELITAVIIGIQAPEEVYTFEKLGLRAAHAISLVSAAIRLGPRNGSARLARVALGAVAPTVLRVPEAERILVAARLLTEETVQAAGLAARAAARPISDIRAGAGYRQAMAGNLVVRGLMRLRDSAQREEAVPHE